MKKRTLLFSMLLTFIVLFSMTVFAAESTRDGIEVSFITDKAAYSSDETITATLTVTNTNNYAVTNVSLENLIPNGYRIDPNSENVKQVDILNGNESVTLTIAFIPDIASAADDTSATETNENNQNAQGDTKNDSSVPTSEKENTRPAGSNSTSLGGDTAQNVVVSSPQTGDNTNIMFCILLITLSGIGVIAALLLGKKKRKALLSIMLCIAMVGSSICVMPAYALESDSVTKSVEISTTVKVADKDITLSAKVSYTLPGSDTPTPTPTPVPVEDDFALIQGGTFQMGSPANEPERSSDETQHSVTVGDFYMAKTEVSQKDYQSVMGVNPSVTKGDNLPVTNITWYDAIQYCNRLSMAEGLTPCYTVSGTTVTWNKAANGYRLPTEAEWEYAARANTTTPFHFGDYVHNSDANCYNAYGYNNDASGNWVNGSDAYLRRTVAVDQYPANSYGLYNMHGNVAEWVWDWYGEYGSGAVTNPDGPESGNAKIIRGGGWNDHPKHIRSAYRGAQPSDVGLYSIGVRPVRNADTAAGEIKSIYNAKAEQKTGKTLIVYFSQTGNTEGLANLIHEISGADIFRLERKIPYSSSSNGPVLYGEALDELRAEAVPELKAYPDIEQYDTILLGYCNWWSSIPASVRSFLLHDDFSGKTIVPFCSMGGGHFGQTISAIAKLAPDSVIKEGLEVTYSSYDRDEISAWLEKSLPAQSEPEPAPEPEPVPEPKDAHVLVAYFSATNNTEKIANHIKTTLGDQADVYEIMAETPYTSADLNYNTDCRANREQNDASARPAISGSVEDMAKYDVIFLGYPIWWGEAPRIISTFLESYDFSGKTVIPFCTSGSSGLGSSATHLHALASNANWLEGRRFSGNASSDAVMEWVYGLGLDLDNQSKFLQDAYKLGKTL